MWPQWFIVGFALPKAQHRKKRSESPSGRKFWNVAVCLRSHQFPEFIFKITFHERLVLGEGPLIQIFKSLYNTSSLQQFNKKDYLSASKFFMSLLVSAPTQFEIFGSINGSAYNIFPFSSLLFICAPVATVQINFISFRTFSTIFTRVTHWNTIPEDSCAVQPKANLSGSVESSKLRIAHPNN